MTKYQLPVQLHKYFWDTDISSINRSKSSLFVIQRLLDKGDDKAIRWIRKKFSPTQIKQALTKLRGFNPKVGNFWALFFNIPKEDILCLQTPYQKVRKTHWPY